VSEARKVVARKPALVNDRQTIWCPGCHYGIITRVVAEAIEELGVDGKTIGVSPVGCSLAMHEYITVDFADALHGRAPAVATGIKRVHGKGTLVFTVQGDGDLCAIGMGDGINAAARGEKITILFLNNTNYGTTGGQLAPTTLVGQRTSTTPNGREADRAGYPIHMAEMMATMKGVVFSARCAVNTAANFQRARKAVKTAFQKQLEGAGFTFVEILSACPPNWHKTPQQALARIVEEVIPEFPLGEFKNVERID
jgi:2-oxoglutarate ferredoxin oxidoreductase subunit beta